MSEDKREEHNVEENETKNINKDMSDDVLENSTEIKGTSTDNMVIIPSSTYKTVKKFIEKVDGMINKNSDIKTLFTDEEIRAITTFGTGNNQTIPRGLYVSALKDTKKDWSTNISYGEELLNSRDLSLSSKVSGSISGNGAIAKFYQKLGMGGFRQIPLWHSGIWVTMRPPSDSEIMNLQYRLAENELDLGRTTNNLIYSGYEAIYTRIVSEFALGCITETTIKLDNINDLLKYIKIQDRHLLGLGLVQVAYSNGFDITHTCNFVGKFENNKPVCTSRVEAKLNPKRLLRIDRSQLTPEHFKHMSKKSPGSTDISDVIQYQNTLKANSNALAKVEKNGEMIYTLELKVPSLKSSIESGEEWVENIISMTQKVFTEDMSVDQKNNFIENNTKSVMLGTYLHFIEKIDMGDGDYISDTNTISMLLNDVICQDKEQLASVIKNIVTFIDKRIMAIVALPNYTCPVCLRDQVDASNKKDPFKEYIPLDVYKTFLDLSAYRVSGIMERTTD